MLQCILRAIYRRFEISSQACLVVALSSHRHKLNFERFSLPQGIRLLLFENQQLLSHLAFKKALWYLQFKVPQYSSEDQAHLCISKVDTNAIPRANREWLDHTFLIVKKFRMVKRRIRVRGTAQGRILRNPSFGDESIWVDEIPRISIGRILWNTDKCLQISRKLNSNLRFLRVHLRFLV